MSIKINIACYTIVLPDTIEVKIKRETDLYNDPCRLLHITDDRNGRRSTQTAENMEPGSTLWDASAPQTTVF
jgi:hypothetical protein